MEHVQCAFFSPAQPWNSVRVASTERDRFWKDAFEANTFLLNRVGCLSEMVTSEAPISAGKGTDYAPQFGDPHNAAD